MHPATSIIAFTTLSGAGYGLAVCLGLGLLEPAALPTRLAHLLALALIGAGLLSSTFHLGNPQRAWRAFSQWRSSWLSREGVAAVLTFAPLVILAGGALLGDTYIAAAGLLGAAMSALTVLCTAMIYASLRSVDAWHTPLTVLCFLLFALAGGLSLASTFAMAGAAQTPGVAWAGSGAIIVAWGAKCLWWRRIDSLSARSTTASATGLGHLGSVRQFEPPHMTDNYLTREMGFSVARKHARKLRRLCLLAAGAVPATLLAAAALSGVGPLGIVLCILASTLLFTGILAERWLFFAEARHSVMAFYGR